MRATRRHLTALRSLMDRLERLGLSPASAAALADMRASLAEADRAARTDRDDG